MRMTSFFLLALRVLKMSTQAMHTGILACSNMDVGCNSAAQTLCQVTLESTTSFSCNATF